MYKLLAAIQADISGDFVDGIEKLCHFNTVKYISLIILLEIPCLPASFAAGPSEIVKIGDNIRGKFPQTNRSGKTPTLL